MNVEQVLQQVGLTDAEVTLYLALLSMGEATASALAEKTATNRTFTYDRLNKLVAIGLASHIVKENKRYFRAAQPSQFLEILKDREVQVRSILPQLESLKAREGEAPRVTVFSSKKGVQTALNLMLKEGTSIYAHGSLLHFKNTMKEGFEIWNQRRIKQRIRLRLLTPENVALEQAEVETLPEEEKTAITTFTFGNKSIIIFWSDVPVATLTESREIARNNITFFNTVWNREIRIYSGVDGIITAFYELIAEQDGYFLGVGYSQSLAQVYGTRMSDEWHETRLRNNVRARLISYNDPESVKYFRKRAAQWKNFNVRFLDPDICGPACVTVSNDLIATFVYTEGSFKVIVNRNKESIGAYRRHFERLWRMAKEK